MGFSCTCSLKLAIFKTIHWHMQIWNVHLKHFHLSPNFGVCSVAWWMNTLPAAGANHNRWIAGLAQESTTQAYLGELHSISRGKSWSFCNFPSALMGPEPAKRHMMSYGKDPEFKFWGPAFLPPADLWWSELLTRPSARASSRMINSIELEIVFSVFPLLAQWGVKQLYDCALR